MHAKPTHSSAGHLPGTGKKQAAPVNQMKGGAAEETTEEEVLMVRRWEGEIDAEALNDDVLELIRKVDGQSSSSEAEQARRCHLSRQELHCIHTTMKSLSLVTLVKWANGRKMDAVFLLGRMVRRLRRRLHA